MNIETVSKKRGRPAAFDYDTALQQAMVAFWQYGYEGTSMATLMSVMQMNKASIYAAYGSKEALFKKAVECYVQGPASFFGTSLAQPSALDVIQSILTSAATMLADPSHPAGCLVTHGALACSDESREVKALLGGYRDGLEHTLAQRLATLMSEQQNSHVDSAVLAKLVMTVHQGMVVQAISGASQTALMRVAEMATRLVSQSLCPQSSKG